MLYTVNMISKITGLTPYTIRYYAKEGLLPFVERSSNGTRLFKRERFGVPVYDRMSEKLRNDN